MKNNTLINTYKILFTISAVLSALLGGLSFVIKRFHVCVFDIAVKPTCNMHLTNIVYYVFKISGFASIIFIIFACAMLICLLITKYIKKGN